MRVAAIDIGSNSIRLLVADVGQGIGGQVVETLARAGEICRLARGLDKSGSIDEAAAQRAASMTADFVRRAKSLGAQNIVVGATAAIRSARNGLAVAEVIGRRAGVPVRILSGDEEARLVYRSVILGLGRSASRSACVAFDIGGGSTEVVSGVGSSAGRWASLPFGAVSLTERHMHSDPPTPEQIDALATEVKSIIMHDCALMPSRVPLLVGVGGTVTVLASMDRELSAYDPVLLEGWCIRPARLASLVERLVQSRQEDRRGQHIIGEGRADIVAAGALVISLLSERFPSAGLICSTQGLRYGLVRMAAEEAAGETGAPAGGEDR
jgi:exopolyphosphatase / guanosine-5'-triphosphate,3'-diphosphate pyrophosphatase